MGIIFETATLSDIEELIALRIKAMRPSLEAIGRFDPDRARQRFLSSFNPDDTIKAVVDDVLVGFIVLHLHDDHLHLDHLYIDPDRQSSGLGTRMIDIAKERASQLSLPVRLCALNKSSANEFYIRSGFHKLRVEEFDTYYEYRP